MEASLARAPEPEVVQGAGGGEKMSFDDEQTAGDAEEGSNEGDGVETEFVGLGSSEGGGSVSLENGESLFLHFASKSSAAQCHTVRATVFFSDSLSSDLKVFRCLDRADGGRM